MAPHRIGALTVSGLQGSYDPNTYDPDDVATWPQPADPGPYVAGMYWTITAAGEWNGAPIGTGDRLHAAGDAARTYGASTFGAGLYAEPVEDGPWSTLTVRFVPWYDRDGWDSDAPPFAGCPLLDGWRVVVESWHNPDDQSRRYGDGNHGAGLYGDLAGVGRNRWVDITGPIGRTLAARGAVGGESWQVPADQLLFDVFDADAWQVLGVPTRAGPNVASVIRVGVLDRLQGYWPVAVGIVETVTDTHDAPPRAVTVEAFGVVTDFAAQLPGVVTRPAEPVTTRLRWIAEQTGYRWGPAIFDADPGPDVTAYGPEPDVSGRELADRSSISAGWSLDTTARGIPRARRWPLQTPGTATPLVVTDCRTATGDAWSAGIVFVADTASTVNRTTVYDTADPPNAATVENMPSRVKVGVQTAGAGVPLPALDAPADRLGDLAGRIVAELSGVLHRVATVDADTVRDPRWLPILARLDRGDPIEVHRTEGNAPTVIAGYVAGIEHDLAPGRWSAVITIHTTTDTIH